ncbi:phosphate ABC transporter substrate-binding protein, PhoT family [Hymenobacter sp. RP-2-7]|uniref:Phosphate ABC transporter substrate-binding protein, PhoT family n=1 Tax=Hymenobacter polaris TaxID=2682546 RepID=A0A7Y0AEH1_9BACT|nr:substrate-binding domain-containing protein [Hymenobacter polaris]NML65860.1 phosphate ABC transporter substrate-binding protein, PhoT family [Hymenobacter polaris]
MNSTNLTRRSLWATLLLTAALLPACNFADRSKGSSEDFSDTPTSGNVSVSVDETFAPILESQVDTFQKLYPDAHIHAAYQPEDSVFLAFLNDKSKAIIVSRKLNADENKALAKQEYAAKVTKIGIDGLAIILHPGNPDSLLTVEQLRGIFSGQTTQWSQLSGQKKLGEINVVFDANRSSTSRYMRDSLLQGKALAPRAFAAQSNPKLLDYVATHPNAIGVAGLNWVSDFDDPQVREYRRRIRVASITARPNPKRGDYIQPYQASLPNLSPELLAANPELQQYPLRRYLYAISREARAGLGSGFVSFVAGQKGQLIIAKSGLMPSNVQARIVNTRKQY